MSRRKIEVKRYAIVDKETGEIIAEDAMFIGQNAFMDKGFRKVFVGFLRDVVLNKKIAGKAIRLLLWMIENLSPNSLEIYMSERMVCPELEINRATYYEWIKSLIEAGVIEKIDTNLYRLIPYSAVNGQMDRAIRNSIKKEKNAI